MDIAVIVAVVLAVGAWQLRSVRRSPSTDPRLNLKRFGGGIVCHGYFVSPQLARKYGHRIPGGAGCYGAP